MSVTNLQEVMCPNLSGFEAFSPEVWLEITTTPSGHQTLVTLRIQSFKTEVSYASNLRISTKLFSG